MYAATASGVAPLIVGVEMADAEDEGVADGDVDTAGVAVELVDVIGEAGVGGAWVCTPLLPSQAARSTAANSTGSGLVTNTAGLIFMPSLPVTPPLLVVRPALSVSNPRKAVYMDDNSPKLTF